MHKSRLGNVIIDCEADDLEQACRFWGAALGYSVELDRNSNGRFASMATPKGDVQIGLQAVKHGPRAHLDIETDDIAAEVARLLSLGARIVEEKEGWTVMEAPTGHRFCVGSPFREGFEHSANRWE